MRIKQGKVVTYSFRCPPPCNQEIRVHAKNSIDAIDKIIIAGAISCRNNGNQCNCKNAHVDMPPIPVEQLKNIVALCMQE